MILSPLQLSSHCIQCPCSPCPLSIPDLKARDELEQNASDSVAYAALLPLLLPGVFLTLVEDEGLKHVAANGVTLHTSQSM